MKKLAIGIILILLVGSFVTVSLIKNRNGSLGGGKTYTVRTQEVKRNNISSSITSNGVIEETERVDVYFDTPMKVRKVLVDNNQQVKKGQKLFELDMDSLNSELEQLRISKDMQELSLKKIKSQNGTSSMEGQIQIAFNNVKAAENTYNENKKTYENNLKLYETNAISKNELDTSKKMLEDSETALKNAKINYETSISTQSIEYQTQVKNLESTNLKIIDLENRINKINSDMLSPMDGTVIELSVKEGSYTSSVQPSLTIINTDKLQVKLNVSEYNMKDVKLGQNVEITGEAFYKDEVVKGKVLEISPIAIKTIASNVEETVVEVIVSINDKKEFLKPGLNVDCKIFTKEKNGVIITGFDTLDEDKDGNKFCYAVDKEKNIMLKRDVKIGITSEMDVEVLEGINEGDFIVIDPQPTYKDGAKVKIAEEKE